MKMRKFAVLAALATVTTGVITGTAVAAPPAPAEQGAVGFTATTVAESAVIKTDAGSLVVEDDVFKIKAADGTVLAGTPLKLRVDEFEFPIAAKISDRTATLTPQLDREHAVFKPVALPFEDKAPWKNEYDREVAAWTRFTQTLTAGVAVGTLVGGLGGAAVGCVLGGIAAGGGATLATGIIGGIFAFLPAAAVGCLAGAAGVGALGTIAGQLLITAPVFIGAAIQYFTTINQPFIPPAPAPAK